MRKFYLKIFIAAFILATTAPTIYAADPVPPNSLPHADQYQEWLKANAQKQDPPSAQPTPTPPPPLPASPPPPFKPIKQSVKTKEQVAVLQPDDYYTDDPEVISPPLSFKQSQRAMVNAAPPSPAPSQEANDAFNIMLRQSSPLTPQQVVKLRQMIDVSQRVAVIPANVPPKPVSSTLIINLAPGATPPAIRLSQGYITTLVFVDSTGSPWPVASYDLGDPKKLGPGPQWDGKSNILLLQAAAPYGDSDLVVRLVGLPTPITLQLVFGQRVVDYRTDIHVSGIGPNSKELPLGTGLPESANQLLLSVLDGIAPSGSKILAVKGGDCQAWLLGEKMYLRTRFTVLSPGWIGRMVSPDGMHAYEIQKSSSVLISQYGQPIELKIEGF